VLYFAIAALVVILDQASKRIVWEVYKYSGGTDVIGDFLRFQLSTNKGAVFGILSNAGHLLLVIRTISIAVLVFFAYRMRYAPAHKRVCLGLILGGAFGNLIDHVAAGEVIDFLDVGIGTHRWPRSRQEPCSSSSATRCTPNPTRRKTSRPCGSSLDGQ
jgi:signal peptidase II